MLRAEQPTSGNGWWHGDYRESSYTKAEMKIELDQDSIIVIHTMLTEAIEQIQEFSEVQALDKDALSGLALMQRTKGAFAVALMEETFK